MVAMGVRVASMASMASSAAEMASVAATVTNVSTDATISANGVVPAIEMASAPHVASTWAVEV